MNGATGSHALEYGVFYGTSDVHIELPGFSVSLLSPRLRAEDVPLHTHPNASFVFVLEGRYLSSADGEGPLFQPCTLFFNPAGTTHRDSFELASGRFLAVSLSQECLRIAADGTRLPGASTAFASGRAIETALRLVRQFLLPGPKSEEVLEALCWELLSDTAGEALWSPARPSWLHRARALLRDLCGQPIRMTRIAQELGVHPVHLARAFRTTFRCTPGEYLARCRMSKALVLLRNSDLALAQIALTAGFCDQSHLSRSFRRHLGISPQAYRRRIGLDEPRQDV
jgi:AraC family transcriptional regulator